MESGAGGGYRYQSTHHHLQQQRDVCQIFNASQRAPIMRLIGAELDWELQQ